MSNRLHPDLHSACVCAVCPHEPDPDQTSRRDEHRAPLGRLDLLAAMAINIRPLRGLPPYGPLRGKTLLIPLWSKTSPYGGNRPFRPTTERLRRTLSPDAPRTAVGGKSPGETGFGCSEGTAALQTLRQPGE
jgi:hypothetical protein